MGELHLEIIVDRLLAEFKVEANVGAFPGRLRETIHAAREAGRAYIRQTGGRASTATSGSPSNRARREPGSSSSTRSSAARSAREYIPAVEKGDHRGGRGGRDRRLPVVDVTVSLIEGSYHEVDSSEMAFKIAGSMAFKAACKGAGHPARAGHGVEVVSPEDFTGDVIGDLSSRAGRIQGIEAGGTRR